MAHQSESDSALSINGRKELHNSFELKPLSKLERGAGQSEPSYCDGLGNSGALARGGRIPELRNDSVLLYTLEEELAVIKKLDRRMVLFLALLYMLSFLDRSNIGNARIAGLQADLNLSSGQYENILMSFYLTYITFEWMALLYRIFPAHKYIALCVAAWGFIASLQSISNSLLAMLFLRALLGISEAAFGPGVPFYMSFFFKRNELALRTGLFISAAPLATSFASVLAWAITKVGEHSPIDSWRLLFLIEGFPSVVIAVFAWYHIPDSPETANFFNAREREVARLRLEGVHEAPALKSSGRGLMWIEIWQALKDPKSYLTAVMFFSCNVAFSSLPPFLPTIIHEMGISALASQALSAPPYLVSFLVVLLTAFLSDRYANRSKFVIFHAVFGGCGYAMIAIAGYYEAGVWWRYAGVYPASAGFFSAITIIITWTINNQDSDSKRGTGVALLNAIGQLGPLLGTRLYPEIDRPYYVRGMSVCAGFMFFVGILALLLRTILMRENKRRCLEEEKGGGEREPFVDRGVRRPKPFMNML